MYVPLCFPPARIHFWLLKARLSFDSSEFGSTVPRNIGLNCRCGKLGKYTIPKTSICLIHARIGEQKRRVLVGDCGGGRDKGVFLVTEEGEELLAHACRGPRAGHPESWEMAVGRERVREARGNPESHASHALSGL